MSHFRADYEIQASLVFPSGSLPIKLNDDRHNIITIKNGEVDSEGHIANLSASVISDCSNMDEMLSNSRLILARQLDLLAFSTHSAFKISRCKSIIEWEPHQRDRKGKFFQVFDPEYPPSPDLPLEIMATVQILAKANLPEYVIQALRYFRYGIIERQPEEQFPHFWLAIETIAEGSKSRDPVVKKCSCGEPLKCTACGEFVRQRPMATDAIRNLLQRLKPEAADQTYKYLAECRHHLTHARGLELLETKVGLPLGTLVNMAAEAAWHFILSNFVLPEATQVQFGHRAGQFTHKELVYAADFQFSHTDNTEHPSDDNILHPIITRQTYFR